MFFAAPQVFGLYATLVADHGKLALHLCDGFGIPNHLLAAPIAL